jgi:2'-5' RNA ligase
MPPPLSYRLFFALLPTEAVRAEMARGLAGLWPQLMPEARRVPPARWHLTLAFLGTFDERPTALIARASASAEEVDGSAFTLCLDRLGHFGGRTRVLWLGPSILPDELARLRTRLVAALQAAGVAVDRAGDFAPHVTIARGVARPPPAPAPAPLAWPVADFTLLLSRQDDAGLAYQRLARWPLGRAAR